MYRRVGMVALVGFICIALSGCVTALRKQKDTEIQGLRTQISSLETQLQAKEQEAMALRQELDKLNQQQEVAQPATAKGRVIGEVKNRPKARQMQIALRNAGYDPGQIDGRMGRQTREAIRAFQRANGLVADGRVGRRTWALLREYLYKKTK